MGHISSLLRTIETSLGSGAGRWARAVSSLIDTLATNPSVSSLTVSGAVSAGSASVSGAVVHGNDTIFTRDDFTPLETPSNIQIADLADFIHPTPEGFVKMSRRWADVLNGLVVPP